jgi:hypothetical protein
MSWTIRGIEVLDKDLNQRYQNSFIEVLLPKEKGPRVVYVNQFDHGLIYIQSFPSAFGHKDVTLVREFPDLGAVEFKGVVHYLSRVPLRQWSRGFNSGVISDYCRVGIPFNERLNLTQAHAAFYPYIHSSERGLR